MRLRLLTVAATLLLFSSGTRAADLTGILTEYVTGKVPPTQESIDQTFKAVFRVWIDPKKLAVERMVLMYTPSRGTDAWALILYGYRSSRSDYLGTEKITYLGHFAAMRANIYRINDGRFGGFFVQDEQEKDGSRTLFLYTPQAYSLTPIPSGLGK